MSRLPDHSSRIICSHEGHPSPFRIEVAPGKLSFGNTAMNTSSVGRQLVVTNVGDHPVMIGEIKTAGAFTATSNAPQYLNPRDHFIIDVYFRPRNEGISTGSVYVTTNGAEGTEYASLIGFGFVAGTDPNGGEGGAGSGILPKYWNFFGNGEVLGFPLDGADAYDKLLYDTYVEMTPGAKDFVGLNPTDFTINPPIAGEPAMITFLGAPLADGAMGYTILRGYAKPYVGPPPIDTVAPDVDYTIIENNTVIDRTKQNALIVVNTNNPITILIRSQAGDDSKDWKTGEFFSVMQHGAGRVTLAMEQDGTLYPALSFLPSTRGRECVISATCIGADTNQWVISGDMQRADSGTERMTLSLTDRSVLIGSSNTVGTGKDSFVMPFGFKLDSALDRGVFASLMTPQAAGNIFTADILRNGVSILNTKLVINNGAKTTDGAVTPPTFVEGGDVFVAGDDITLSITQVGNGTARGIRVYLTGTRV